jgi:hypothetical protein
LVSGILPPVEGDPSWIDEVLRGASAVFAAVSAVAAMFAARAAHQTIRLNRRAQTETALYRRLDHLVEAMELVEKLPSVRGLAKRAALARFRVLLALLDSTKFPACQQMSVYGETVEGASGELEAAIGKVQAEIGALGAQSPSRPPTMGNPA